MEKKILITGTGRSGTTLIMQILTELGYDTGFKDKNHDWRDWVRAGQEMGYPVHLKYNNKMELYWTGSSLRDKQLLETYPRIIKSPTFTLHLKKLLDKDIIELEHVIIPIREVDKCVASRKKANLMHEPLYLSEITDEMVKEKVFNYIMLGHLLEALAFYNLDHTYIKYPEMVYSPDYLYYKLKGIFWNMNKGRFIEVHQELAKEELVTIK